MEMTPQEIAQKAVTEWFAYQNAFELEIACRILREYAPEVILEIGVANGASLAAWAAATSADLVIGIDPLTNPKTPEQEQSFKQLIEIYRFQIIPYISRLPETHKQLTALLNGRKIDFLFIDAEHRYDDVRHDYYHYLPYMAPKSIIGFHDIYYNDLIYDSGSQVSTLWERVKRENNYFYDEFHFHSTMGIGFVYRGY